MYYQYPYPYQGYGYQQNNGGYGFVWGIIIVVKEELGIDISKYDITEFDSGCDGKDCYKMYYVKADLDIADLNIQKEELTLVKYFSMQELEEMVENKTLNQDQVDFFIKCKEFIEKNKKI